MSASFRTKTERIQKDLETLAQYTDGSGEGITRLTYTPEEMAARRYLAAEMEKAGMIFIEDVDKDSFKAVAMDCLKDISANWADGVYEQVLIDVGE